MAGAPLLTRAKAWSRSWHANIGIATAVTLGAIAISCPFIAHKCGDLAIGKALMKIHYGEFLAKDLRWIWIDTQGLALLFLIVSGWLIHHRSVKKAANTAAEDPSVPGSSVAIVHANASPEATKAAQILAEAAQAHGIRTLVTTAASYRQANLTAERWLFVITDGQSGDGAQVFSSFLGGTPAPKLRNLKYSIFAAASSEASPADLEIDRRLAELGATRIQPVTCKGANPDTLRKWVDDVVLELGKKVSAGVRGTTGASQKSAAAQ